MPLLLICWKLMEKFLFNSIFNFTDTRNMLSVHQSGFRPGNSCVHQLVSIVHEFYNAFDANSSLEVRGVFLDISKAFDRVWHWGLLYKLKCIGINGNFLKLVENFLSTRYRCSTRINTWSFIFSYLHQWFIWKSEINCQTFCRRYINISCC